MDHHGYFEDWPPSIRNQNYGMKDIIAEGEDMCSSSDEASTGANTKRAFWMSLNINGFSLHPKFHDLLGKILKLNRSSLGGKFLARPLREGKPIFHNLAQLNLARAIILDHKVNLVPSCRLLA